MSNPLKIVSINKVQCEKQKQATELAMFLREKWRKKQDKQIEQLNLNKKTV